MKTPASRRPAKRRKTIQLNTTTDTLKNVNMNSTRSSFADDEWDNTVEIPVNTTPSYSNCVTDNGKTNHNIYITDQTLNVDIFEPCKPSQVCLTAHDSPQITKEPKLATNLGNKRLEHVIHTSDINSNLNCNGHLVAHIDLIAFLV